MTYHTSKTANFKISGWLKFDFSCKGDMSDWELRHCWMFQPWFHISVLYIHAVSNHLKVLCDFEFIGTGENSIAASTGLIRPKVKSPLASDPGFLLVSNTYLYHGSFKS
jgi:hypothetical protein